MKPIIKFFVGLPASGKSNYANKLKEEGYKIHSSDELRKELYGSYNVFDKNAELFDELHKRIKADLIAGNNVVYDATGLIQKKRIQFLKFISKVGCEKEAVVMATPYHMCLAQDKAREKSVGKDVLKRMYFNFEFPLYAEGWNKITLRYHSDIDWSHVEYNCSEVFAFINKIDQHNDNHTLTIGQHCFAVAVLVSRKTDEISVIDAGFLHDFSKYKTLSFENGKGEFSQKAHYYQHQCPSSYDSMFYLKQMFREDEQIIKSAQLISEHMKPHFLKDDKATDKYKSFVGVDFFKELMIIHEADCSSR